MLEKARGGHYSLDRIDGKHKVTGTAHYACVDEVRWDGSDYITLPNVSGDKEMFGHGSLSTTPGWTQVTLTGCLASQCWSRVVPMRLPAPCNMLEVNGRVFQAKLPP